MNTSKLYDAPIWSTSTILIVRKNGVRPTVNDFVTDWSKTNSYTNNVFVLFALLCMCDKTVFAGKATVVKTAPCPDGAPFGTCNWHGPI